jgi:transmembrane 9 superfamily protein 3
VNGYTGGSLYARMGGECNRPSLYDLLKPILGQIWMKQLVVGAFLVPVIICGVSFLVNFISIYYGSSRSIPFTVMVCLKNFVYFLSIDEI